MDEMDFKARSRGVVFPPWKKFLSIAGIKGSKVPIILITFGLGIGLFFFAGTFMINVDEELSILESNTYQRSFQDIRTALQTQNKYYKSELESKGIEENNLTTEQSNEINKTVSAKLTEEEKDNISLAKSYGITKDTTDAQLEQMVPKTKEVQKEQFEAIPRAFVCIILPTVLVWIYHLDLKGFTLASEFKRIKQFRKRQRYYISKKFDYLEYEKF